MEKPYMVKQTIFYSDGSETTLNYEKNENQEVIETVVAKEVEEHRGEAPMVEPEMASEPIEEETVEETSETVEVTE